MNYGEERIRIWKEYVDAIGKELKKISMDYDISSVSLHFARIVSHGLISPIFMAFYEGPVSSHGIVELSGYRIDRRCLETCQDVASPKMVAMTADILRREMKRGHRSKKR